MFLQRDRNWLKAFYNKQAVNAYHGKRDKAMEFYIAHRFNKTIEIFPPDLKGRKFLDIGCGRGSYTVFLLKRGSSGYALDFSGEYLRFAKQAMEEERVHCELIEGDACELPFLENSFDLILLLEIIEHIPDYQRVLAKVKRVLAGGGELIISVPLKYCYRETKIRLMLNLTRIKCYLKQLIYKFILSRSFSPAPPFTEHIYYFRLSDVFGILKERDFFILDYTFSGYFAPFQRTLLKSTEVQKGYLVIEKYLSKTFLRNFAWNVIIRCRNEK